MSAELDALALVINAAVAVNQSAAALIPLLTAATVADKAQMTALADSLTNSSKVLDDIVKANTPPVTN